MHQPFPSAQAAWFWTMAVLEHRRGAIARTPPPACCRAEDVLRCLDTLYRNRRVELAHGHVLRVWGRRGRAPSPHAPGDASDLRLWREAMAGLDGRLRRAGIVTDAASLRLAAE